MPDLFVTQLALDQAKDIDVRDLVVELVACATKEKNLRDRLLSEVHRDREIRDGKPFRLSSAQQKTIDRYEADAVVARQELKRLMQMIGTDKELVQFLFSTEKQQFELDGQLWRDKKGHLSRQVEQDIQDLAVECLKKIEAVAARKQIPLSLV